MVQMVTHGAAWLMLHSQTLAGPASLLVLRTWEGYLPLLATSHMSWPGCWCSGRIAFLPVANCSMAVRCFACHLPPPSS